MLQIILTWTRKPIHDSWHYSPENGGHDTEFLENFVNQFLGIQSIGCARLVVLWSFAHDSHSNTQTTDTQSCTTLLSPLLDLHKLSLAQMCWINALRISLNFWALAFVTGPTGTWIRSMLHLLVTFYWQARCRIFWWHSYLQCHPWVTSSAYSWGVMCSPKG